MMRVICKKKPLITASIHRHEGIIHRYQFDKKQKGCARCLRTNVVDKSLIDSCSERGVLGVLPGVFGAIQSNIALYHLLNIKTLPHSTSFTLDMRTLKIQQIVWDNNSQCLLCAPRNKPTLASLHVNNDINSLEITSIDQVKGSIIIDIREKDEIIFSPTPDHLNILHHPLSSWDNDCLSKDKKYIILCAKGIRSIHLAFRLHNEGYKNIYSLRGGAKNLLS